MKRHSDWLHEAIRNTQCGENLREEYDEESPFDFTEELACDELDEEK